MRSRITRTIELFLFICLLMPAGMLLATESSPSMGLTAKTANRYDVEEASTLLNRIQNLAINARAAVGPINTMEIDLRWQGQATMLNRARSKVDRMGDDLLRLDEISSKLEPWQQNLVHKISPHVHEMAYQLDAAIKTLNKYQLRDRLALTQYPQNIHDFCRNSSQVVSTINTVTQYVRADQKMAELNRTKGPEAKS